VIAVAVSRHYDVDVFWLHTKRSEIFEKLAALPSVLVNHITHSSVDKNRRAFTVRCSNEMTAPVRVPFSFWS
jgi:hypothetical protein